MHVGIDYGSKLAGTTVLCYEQAGKLRFIQSEKKRDADQLIKDFVREHYPEQFFIDAPLSLPKAFYGKGDDFFYREADRITKAMSPMFLGGLTARAVKLKYELTPSGVSFFEAYPGGLAKHLALKPLGYKQKQSPSLQITRKITAAFHLELLEPPTNWHQFDALLAWIIGHRFHTNTVASFGDPEEGIIYY